MTYIPPNAGATILLASALSVTAAVASVIDFSGGSHYQTGFDLCSHASADTQDSRVEPWVQDSMIRIDCD